MKYFTPILIGAAFCGSAHATVTFHTDFDEASLGAIAGLNIDTPAPAAGNGNDGSGTVVLDTVNQTLDITAQDANMWTTRDGAPIAWVSSPVVALGDIWYAETVITHADSPGGTASGYDQAGILFYSGTAGSNPGSENTGTHQSLFLGINDWNAYHHTIQGFADNNPHSTTEGVAVVDTAGDNTFEYRVEVTENGASDLYNFFYREDPGAVWTQYGPTNLSQDFDNTAVGIWVKTHNDNTGSTSEFDRFTVGVVPEPSTGILAGLAGIALVMRRRRK